MAVEKIGSAEAAGERHRLETMAADEPSEGREMGTKKRGLQTSRGGDIEVLLMAKLRNASAVFMDKHDDLPDSRSSDAKSGTRTGTDGAIGALAGSSGVALRAPPIHGIGDRTRRLVRLPEKAAAAAWVRRSGVWR